MDETEKLLRKRNKQDRDRILAAMKAIREGRFSGLHVKKLSGSTLFRARVGDFRIIFSVDKKTHTAQIVSVRLRDEGTYR